MSAHGKNGEKTNNPDLMRRGNRFTTETGYINRINLFSSRFEYIGNSRDYFYLICKDCGTVIRKSKVSFKPSHRGVPDCPKCTQILKEIKQRDKEERRNNYIAYLEQCRQKREEKAKENIKTLVCQRCGKEFSSGKWRRKYCSQICLTRQSCADREHIRRTQINAQRHESISLSSLSKRDKDVCWICKQKVDWSDFEIRANEVFVAGERYPSIDHVMPLAKGGAHTWDNVKLAHRGCNAKKKDSLTVEEQNGQFRLAL